MSQPLTHYLVTRRAIPEEYRGDWWDKYKPYFGLGSSAPDLFYFPLVPVVKNIREDIDWASIANPLHSAKSYDMFCSLLHSAKKQKLEVGAKAEKLFAFAVGYYCHVITDCVFHPYVYRSTGDYWHTVSEIPELKHKKQEYFIDTAIFEKYYPSHDLSRIQWQCNEGMGELLDFDIARLFNQAMLINYADCYSPELEVETKEHPIQQAYSAMAQSIIALFEGKEIHLFGSRITYNVRDFLDEKQERFFISSYPNCETLNSYTPEDLFNFSSSACRKLFRNALGFWESGETDAQAYFGKHPSHYINSGNWNLDTGLPTRYNNDTAMRDASSKQYSYMADVIKNTLSVLQAEYNPSEFETA